MIQTVRSTLAGTIENPGRPQEERGGSPEDVLARVLFTAQGAANEAALQRVYEALSEIKDSTQPVVTPADSKEEVAAQTAPYRSAYIPENHNPIEAATTQIAELEKKPSLFRLFRSESPDKLFAQRQARKAA